LDMGRLVDQYCAAGDESFYQSPAGQSILLFTLGLIGGSPGIDPHSYLDPYLATAAQVHSMLERLVHGSKMPQSSLIVGLIRAIENVLEDCLEEVSAPGQTHNWSLATERLIHHGLLVDAEGLTLVGDSGAPSLDQLRQARADLQRWQERTAPILEEQNLEQARCEETEHEDS
jgi:hypothetical protein